MKLFGGLVLLGSYVLASDPLFEVEDGSVTLYCPAPDGTGNIEPTTEVQLSMKYTDDTVDNFEYGGLSVGSCGGSDLDMSLDGDMQVIRFNWTDCVGALGQTAQMAFSVEKDIGVDNIILKSFTLDITCQEANDAGQYEVVYEFTLDDDQVEHLTPVTGTTDGVEFKIVTYADSTYTDLQDTNFQVGEEVYLAFEGYAPADSASDFIYAPTKAIIRDLATSTEFTLFDAADANSFNKPFMAMELGFDSDTKTWSFSWVSFKFKSSSQLNYRLSLIFSVCEAGDSTSLCQSVIDSNGLGGETFGFIERQD